MHGAFKLDHLHPLKPILCIYFSIFPLSYWEVNSYYRGYRAGRSSPPTNGECLYVIPIIWVLLLSTIKANEEHDHADYNFRVDLK